MRTPGTHYSKDELFGLLEKQGRKLTWLAKATGYSVHYLSLMKAGKKPVTEAFANKAATALGLLSSDIFLPTESRKGDETAREQAAD